MSAPIRKRLESGIYERVDSAGNRLGLEIQYKDADGHPRRRAVSGNLHAARDELAAARSRRARHELEPADPRMTLDVVIDRFEAAHTATLRRNSQGSHRSAFKRIRPELGRKRITAIGRADIRKFIATDIEAGYKANTIRSHYSVLRAIFNFAATDLEIPVIFPRLKPGELPDPADDQREHRVLTDDELAKLLAACDEQSRLYFRTLGETGCRKSEGLGLTPQRVGDETIAFAQQLSRHGGVLRPLKTRQSKRTLEATRGLTAALRLAAGPERVFEQLTHTIVEEAWADAVDGAHLTAPQPVIHDLRHTHASKLIAAGWDPVEVAARLGDRVETVLRVYAHEFDARRRSAERRALLETLYGEDGDQMATSPPSQTITNTPKIQRLRTGR